MTLFSRVSCLLLPSPPPFQRHAVTQSFSLSALTSAHVLYRTLTQAIAATAVDEKTVVSRLRREMRLVVRSFVSPFLLPSSSSS